MRNTGIFRMKISPPTMRRIALKTRLTAWGMERKKRVMSGWVTVMACPLAI